MFIVLLYFVLFASLGVSLF